MKQKGCIKMTDKEIRSIENNVNATLKHEGLTASKKGKSITRLFLENKITSKEAIKRIKEYHLKLTFIPVCVKINNVGIVKINPKFGENFYNSIQSILFYSVVIAVVIALIKTLTSENLKISQLIIQILISALIVFIIYNPLLLVNLGSNIFDFISALLSDLNYKEGVSI